MSHWVKLAQDLYASKDEKTILTMLKVEMEGDRRAYVIQRIFAHYNSTRRRRELEAISTWMKSNKRVAREAIAD